MRRRAAPGVACRLAFWSQTLCRSLAFVATVIPQALALSSVIPVASAERPMLLELFAGSAALSRTFSDMGAYTLQPHDLLWGWDIFGDGDYEAVVDAIRLHRPRLLTILFSARPGLRYGD